ncbi:GNAT family N-acetyltransferase [Solimicrobium silvestre]|uniref:Acetyltransferase (GNAT) domain n=1 Tax=Solimicrobium silvestre TaxID=2099400 RepID=A0A2S9H1T7_9BURK|nr:GNAT family N-acetyltransferase [Solimicrobium silvestre]PRC93955.1 Acetyltransferase (GNAT) domain [Solimicrobium silvestre]
MLTFAPIKFDNKTLALYVSLFSTCFPKSTKFTPEYLQWLYCKNPAGLAIGFDAWDGEILAAHYVCVPTFVSINGVKVQALLSLNTATHPLYQGKGLFTKLAEQTYSAGAENNFDCVYGVANANSTPGFIGKLGFQLVDQLDARFGVGHLNIDFEVAKRNTQFERIWSADCLNWRCSNPENTVYQYKHSDFRQFYASSVWKSFPVYAETLNDQAMDLNRSERKKFLPVRLFLGLIPDGASQDMKYLTIPLRLRPSPLNLIFRSLTGNVQKIEKGHASLSFLDFDAY